MVEILDIVDAKSLEAWLVGRPDDWAWQIARRAALRIVPAWWASCIDPQGDYDAAFLLPVLNVALIGSPATRVNFGAEYFDRVANAALRVDKLAEENKVSDVKLTSAAKAISATIFSDASLMGVEHFSKIVDHAVVAIKLFYADDTHVSDRVHWRVVQNDCHILVNEGELPQFPLFFDVDAFVERWTTLKSLMPVWQDNTHESHRTPPKEDWSFWVRWCDDLIAGKPISADLVMAIISELTDEDWQAGSRRVNARIAAIESRFAAAASYNSERLERDAQDGLVRTVVETTLPADGLVMARDRMRDAVEWLRGLPVSGNMCLADILADELSEVDSYLHRYADVPLRLYEVCLDTKLAIEARQREGEVPEHDSRVARFLRQLDRSSSDIWAEDEQVARTLRQRSSIKFNRMNEAEKERLVQVTHMARGESKPDLSEELAEDLANARDDKLDEKIRDDSRYRLGSRLLRFRQLNRDEVVKAADDVSKLGKGAGAAWGLADFILRWFV
ncbi:hypothetical protein [Litorivita pollutaquae]|nr:hypothetical protein [Litorivita pollutaquae]